MLIDEVEAIWAAIAERDDWRRSTTRSPRSGGWARRCEARIVQMLEKSPRLRHKSAVTASPDLDRARDRRELVAGKRGDVDAEVAAARAAWADWAAQPLAYPHRDAAPLRQRRARQAEPFADLIARETGKPLWEARTEVEAVVAKVEISVAAYAERTAQRKLDGAMGARVAVRHKPHGVLAVLGPYNFPAHLPNGHIVPALIAGNAVVFKPSEKTPAVGEFLVKLLPRGGRARGRASAASAGPDEGKALAAHAGIDGLLFTGSARAGLALNRSSPTRRTRSWRSKWAATIRWWCGTPRTSTPPRRSSSSRPSQRRPALHRGAAADRQGRRARGADRDDREADRPADRRRSRSTSRAPFMGPVIDNARRRPAPGASSTCSARRPGDPAARARKSTTCRS